MARGGFVVNWDGKQRRTYEVKAYYDEHKLNLHAEQGGESEDVKDWSTFSVHAVTKQEAEDILSGAGKTKEVK